MDPFAFDKGCGAYRAGDNRNVTIIHGPQLFNDFSGVWDAFGDWDAIRLRLEIANLDESGDSSRRYELRVRSPALDTNVMGVPVYHRGGLSDYIKVHKMFHLICMIVLCYIVLYCHC